MCVVPLLTNKDISLTERGRLYSRCVQSSMLHGSETWSVRKENEVALQQAEWSDGYVALSYKFQVNERERLGLDDIISVLQQNRLRCMGMCCKKKTVIG